MIILFCFFYVITLRVYWCYLDGWKLLSLGLGCWLVFCLSECVVVSMVYRSQFWVGCVCFVTFLWGFVCAVCCAFGLGCFWGLACDVSVTCTRYLVLWLLWFRIRVFMFVCLDFMLGHCDALRFVLMVCVCVCL